MRRVLVIGSLTLLLAGTGGATTVPSGLFGVVTRGPISPVCVAEQPCDAPAPGVRLQFVRGGVVVARARTRGDGSYRIRLGPGQYYVRGPHSIQPVRVNVPSGRFRHVDFSFDTGIR